MSYSLLTTTIPDSMRRMNPLEGPDLLDRTRWPNLLTEVEFLASKRRIDASGLIRLAPDNVWTIL